MVGGLPLNPLGAKSPLTAQEQEGQAAAQECAESALELTGGGFITATRKQLMAGGKWSIENVVPTLCPTVCLCAQPGRGQHGEWGH